MSAALRWSLAGLSVVLLTVLGMLGEELQSLARLPMPKCGAAAALPVPTQLAFDAFGINAGHFLLSVTPFMVAFGAIAACARDTPAPTVLARFAMTWLVALSYTGLYAWAMLLPFHLGCADLEDKPMPWIVLAIDAALLAAAVVAFRRARR